MVYQYGKKIERRAMKRIIIFALACLAGGAVAATVSAQGLQDNTAQLQAPAALIQQAQPSQLQPALNVQPGTGINQ